MGKQKMIAVVGPTASGKTGLSVSLAAHFGGEIISADSMQIYREMNIGTAKPTLEERQGIPHHLMGHIGVEDTYNVATYVEDARSVLQSLEKRGVLPILCGGTGLYLDHLLNNTDFFDIPLKESLREKYQELAEKEGAAYLYALLKKVDPVLAQKLHPNDVKRVIRGLEVYESTGRKLSDFQLESKRSSPYDVLWIGLNYRDRQLLYDRIDRRVDLMESEGLLDEIQYLMAHYKLSSTARAAIGYKEVIDALESGGSVAEALSLVKQKSRNYAKRQLTWFHKNEKIHWFYRDELDDDTFLSQAIQCCEKFLEGGNE